MVKTRDTTARKAIIEILQNSNEPKTVKEIIYLLQERAIDVDRTTVFRVMNAFTNREIVKNLNLVKEIFDMNY